MKIVISAGPTREAIDPVRFITNRSSGKMGYAIAAAARERGMDVVLISGPVTLPPPQGVDIVQVESAAEMAEAVRKAAENADIIIMSAAVADYRPAAYSSSKIKKSDNDLVIELERTEDILLSLGRAKKPGQILVGFAAETDDLLQNAQSKLERKNLDFIAANIVGVAGRGFGAENNAVTLLGRNGFKHEIALKSKADLAIEMLEVIFRQCNLSWPVNGPKRKFSGRKWWNFLWKRLLGFALLLVIIFMMIGYLIMEKLLFGGCHTSEKSGNLELLANNFKLDAFYHPPLDNKTPVILFSHGNGDTLSGLKDFIAGFIRRGYGIMCYDYAGYGASEGSPGEIQSYADIKSAYDYLTQTAGIAPERIVVLGFSVGTGPSAYLAVTEKVGTLVLAAPFASAIEVKLPFPLPGNRFCTADRVSKSSVPLLLFHGGKDSVIPFRNAEKIFRMARGIKKFVALPEADHNIIDEAGPLFWNELAIFLQEHLSWQQ